MANKLIVGGVPEHFNAPWHLAVENGDFTRLGVEVQFKEVPEGTGKMCAGLRDGSLDAAVVLTEGIVKDILDGNPSKIFATYVESPLTWGIFVNPDSDIKSVDELRGKTIGISRYGSGSHLMSFVLADEKEWLTQTGCDFKFAIKNNLAGLREGIRDKTADAFLWERIMTKPFVDNGELKQVGTIVTPWPCFMVAVRNEVLETKYGAVKKMMQGIQESCRKFKEQPQTSTELVSKNFHLKYEDAETWFQEVRYSESGKLSRKVLVSTIDTLIRSKVLPGDNKEAQYNFETLYEPRAPLAEVDPAEIRTMKLFYVKRLLNQLKAISKEINSGKKLSVPELIEYDVLHYNGVHVIDQAASLLGFDETKTVLEVGSGLGGPARYMAWKYACNVIAVEIEEERQSIANTLTLRCGLEKKVTHVCGDASTLVLREGSINHFVSWLSILHINQGDRESLFRNLNTAMTSRGSFVIEDFYARRPLTGKERTELDIAVACPYCPSRDEYVSQLERNGFEVISCDDLTENWTNFVSSRLSAFEENRTANIAVHGEKVVDGVSYFYKVISDLYQQGNLGGIRIHGRKKY